MSRDSMAVCSGLPWAHCTYIHRYLHVRSFISKRPLRNSAPPLSDKKARVLNRSIIDQRHYSSPLIASFQSCYFYNVIAFVLFGFNTALIPSHSRFGTQVPFQRGEGPGNPDPRALQIAMWSSSCPQLFTHHMAAEINESSHVLPKEGKMTAPCLFSLQVATDQIRKKPAQLWQPDAGVLSCGPCAACGAFRCTAIKSLFNTNYLANYFAGSRAYETNASTKPSLWSLLLSFELDRVKNFLRADMARMCAFSPPNLLQVTKVNGAQVPAFPR